MTPEEAKPHVFRYASTQGQPGDVQLEKETGERMPIGTPFFTAKETAEVAKGYAHAKYIFIESMRRYKRIRRDLRNADHYYYLADKAYKQITAYENLFKEWSK